MDKILIIEDHVDCQTLYRDIFKGHDLVILSSLKELGEHVSTTNLQQYDVVLADLMLGDGYFLDWISQNISGLMEEVPTIIVSSMEDLEILRRSFEWGAADFIIKPFRKAELQAKVEKVKRNFTIQPVKNKDLEHLTFIELKLFILLSQNPEKYLSREEIVQSIWKKVQVKSKVMDVHLSRLRKKLDSSLWTIECLDDIGWKIYKTKSLK